jgi:hypothetical protein
MKCLFAFLITLFIFNVPGAIAAFECSASVSTVLIYKDGSVNVLHSGRGDYTVICNLNSDRLGVAPTTCAMWTSMLLNLKKDAKKAYFYYDDAPQYNSCATLPTYGSSPAPVYIGPVI